MAGTSTDDVFGRGKADGDMVSDEDDGSAFEQRASQALVAQVSGRVRWSHKVRHQSCEIVNMESTDGSLPSTADRMSSRTSVRARE